MTSQEHYNYVTYYHKSHKGRTAGLSEFFDFCAIKIDCFPVVSGVLVFTFLLGALLFTFRRRCHRRHSGALHLSEDLYSVGMLNEVDEAPSNYSPTSSVTSDQPFLSPISCPLIPNAPLMIAVPSASVAVPSAAVIPQSELSSWTINSTSSTTRSDSLADRSLAGTRSSTADHLPPYSPIPAKGHMPSLGSRTASVVS